SRRSRSVHHRVRVRHLRTGVHEPARGSGQRRGGGVLLAAARAHAASAVDLAREGQGASMKPGRRWGLDFVLLVTALCWILPYVWMTLTSFKTLPEIVRDPTAPLPQSLDFSAYGA